MPQHLDLIIGCDPIDGQESATVPMAGPRISRREGERSNAALRLVKSCAEGAAHFWRKKESCDSVSVTVGCGRLTSHVSSPRPSIPRGCAAGRARPARAGRWRDCAGRPPPLVQRPRRLPA
eukprot:SAG31_NODE_4978_length_2823_cov_1.544420_4_plen_120_part_01